MVRKLIRKRINRGSMWCMSVCECFSVRKYVAHGFQYHLITVYLKLSRVNASPNSVCVCVITVINVIINQVSSFGH